MRLSEDDALSLWLGVMARGFAKRLTTVFSVASAAVPDRPAREGATVLLDLPTCIMVAAAGSATVVLLIAIAVGRTVPESLPAEVKDQFLPSCRSALVGNEVDRGLYLAGLAIYPLMLLACTPLAGLAVKDAAIRGRWAESLRKSGLPLLVCLGVYALWLASLSWTDLEELPETRRSWAHAASIRVATGLACLPITAWLLAGGGTWATVSRRRMNLGAGVVATMMLGLFLMGWFTADRLTAPVLPHHFNAVHHSVVQVCLGRPLLVGNNTHQYGLYPHFLEPLLAVTGHDVGGFTFVLQALRVLVWLLLLTAACRLFQRPAWALFTWFTLVYLAAFMLLGRFIGARPVDNIDIYFQYDPIRTLFPAILIYFLVDEVWLRGWRWWLATAVLAAGLLWNLDSGLVVWLTWIAVCWHDAICMHGWHRPRAWLSAGLGRTAAAAGIAVAALAVFAATTFLRYGEWPQLTLLTRYQQIFYAAGFLMLPMRLFHLWQIVLLVYAVGLAVGLRAIMLCDRSITPRAIFGLSVVGCGLFAYYNGRSHDAAFPSVIYPAILVGGMLLEQLHGALQGGGDEPRPLSGSGLRWVPVAIVACVAAQALGGMLYFCPRFGELIASLHDRKGYPYAAEEDAFLRECGRDEGSLFVFSINRSGHLCAVAGRPWPVDLPGIPEVMLLEQVLPLVRFLNDGRSKRVVIDELDCKLWMDIAKPYLEMIRDAGGEAIAASPHGTLRLVLIPENR